MLTDGILLANSQLLLVAIVALMLFFLICITAVSLLLLPWLRAFTNGAPISMFHVLGMRLRGNSPKVIIDAYIALIRAQVPVTIGEVEQCYIDNRSRILTSDDLVMALKKQRPA